MAMELVQDNGSAMRSEGLTCFSGPVPPHLSSFPESLPLWKFTESGFFQIQIHLLLQVNICFF